MIFARSIDESFCEPSFEPFIPVDADLIQVQVITRHGARTPLHKQPGNTDIWQCSNSEHKSYSEDSSGANIHVAFGSSLFGGDCHFGQLLGKGQKQLSKIGKHLRKLYIDQLKFLPSKFDKEIILFRSTNTQRTKNSLISLASSLYPGEKISFKYADKIYDHWRRKASVCPGLLDQWKKLSKSSEWNIIGLENSSFMSKVAKSLKTKWSATGDILTSSLCEGFSITPNMTKEDITNAIALKTRQHLFIYNHDDVFPLFFGYQAADMVNEMLKRISGQSQAKFIHWSAHDGNINAFLGYIGISSSDWPQYGTYITMELYKYRKHNQYFLRFTMNGKKLTSTRLSSFLIPLDKFVMFVKNFMPSKEDCKYNKKKFMESDVFIPEAL
ncbi:Histidine acid phosphatase family protein [Trichomonas vaginalis G3]|uniref:Histidine acid phosphatase family protein n=1 Tax=Trichomonas vaginalis (strain ATCC PRA-98 / G3) TaxID=412133 RepID=A2F7C4_TRIV3|nr:histidine acid phosphatase [Trichomonas vaginalis G3]EAX99192.1 Histidine acid phosphatase family protein [Trichomonas vaginalis G3]KAI5487969.1 acid phosphatase protein [Trichomonas vaginalis G3]|eukprot:XP_001312122.1 histidine acid phosphatase [Trichomonas vaginalis G3]